MPRAEEVVVARDPSPEANTVACDAKAVRRASS